MFGIYRKDGGVVTLGQVRHNRACGNEGLLVGQGDYLSGLDCGDGRSQAAEADHGRHHYVHPVAGYQVAHGLHPCENLCVRILKCLGKREITGIVAYHHVVGIEFPGLCGHKPPAALAGKELDFKAVRMLADHVKCLPADRPGRSQDCYPSFLHQKLIYFVGSTASPLCQSSKCRWSPSALLPVPPTMAIAVPALTLSPVFFISFWLCL